MNIWIFRILLLFPLRIGGLLLLLFFFFRRNFEPRPQSFPLLLGGLLGLFIGSTVGTIFRLLLLHRLLRLLVRSVIASLLRLLVIHGLLWLLLWLTLPTLRSVDWLLHVLHDVAMLTCCRLSWLLAWLLWSLLRLLLGPIRDRRLVTGVSEQWLIRRAWF